ncbi:MAG: YfhO family protein [Acetobacter sp.]|nr:YfhO family protein [Bacteroides sp.]MCM1340602.1 YfhO family protein [Acetobacter sp.]MCM1433342.1 YfhO family protein [Clostridiales bacterium]
MYICNDKIDNIKTNQFINGETAAYSIAAVISVFLFASLKQILKIFIGLNAQISISIAFVIAEVVLYLFEKRFVFRKAVLSSNLKQIILLVFRSAVNFGFYGLSDFLFSNILKMETSFVWLIAVCSSIGFNYFFDRILLFDCDYKAESVKKSKIYIGFYSYRFVLLTVLMTVLSISVIYIISSAFPFGDYTIMRMDLYHQYGPLFAELYDRVINHHSFIYSWYSGGGSSFLGNYLNYLSSPLTALIFLFDKENIASAITFLVAVKCVLSAASFSLYLKKSQNFHNIFNVALSVLYAFSAYMLAYYWNVMWIDAMILLPFIALGIENIINGKKITLYVSALALLFFSSYYMGFMCCIFAVIYFIFYYVLVSEAGEKVNPKLKFAKKYTFKELNNSKFFNRCVKFAVGSILSACICAITLMPVFMILRSSSATSDSFPSTFESYYNIFDFITSHFAALETTIRSSGEDVLPNIYSGIPAIILFPLFIINKKISLKEKAAYIVVLLLLLFSFNNNCMNFIWHAFHFPNDLPFRFSYIYSFLLLIAAAKCLANFDGFKAKDICYVGFLWLFFIVIAQKMPTTKMDSLTIYITIALLILWCGFFYMLKSKKAPKIVKTAICLLLVFSESIISGAKGLQFYYENKDYSSSYQTTISAVDKIKESDKDFYRFEQCYLETRMDPCYYGYNGMSTFSSMAYENYSQLQYSLGMFGNRINSYTYNPQTAVYNAMFNIKYLMHSKTGTEPDPNLFEYKFSSDDEETDIYENLYNLPIAYAVNSELENWDTEEGNPFAIQSDFFRLSTGYSNVFEKMNFTKTEADSVICDTVTENGTYWISDINASESNGYAYVTISPKINGNAYLYVTSPDVTSIEVENGDSSVTQQNIEEPYILDLGYYEAGEEATITIDCSSVESESTNFEIYAYSLNHDVFEQGFSRLKTNSIEITDYSETKLEGTITVSEDGYLYSSIPFDKGWTIEIDGQKTETFEIGNAMLGTMIKAGKHTVTYTYSPKGLNYGTIISAITVEGICGYAIYSKLKSRKADIDSELSVFEISN